MTGDDLGGRADSEGPDFENRIAKLRALNAQRGVTEGNSGEDAGIPGAMSFGLRARAQFVSAVVVGGGLGWAIDRWLGTSPFGMLVLMVLGFVAAMTNVWLTMSKAVATASKQISGDTATPGNGVLDEIDGKSS